MDIGFGDVVTPAPQELAFPALIDTVPQAEIKAYSLETVVAEKFHAMIVLSLANSRMKDFFDVYRILVTGKVDSIGCYCMHICKQENRLSRESPLIYRGFFRIKRPPILLEWLFAENKMS